MDRFESSLEFVLRSEVEPGDPVSIHEIGPKCTDNPNDPGGFTNDGVTQRVYDAFRTSHGVATRPVSMMTAGERNDIYADKYWTKCGCHTFPAPIDFVMFDYAVNSGVRQATRDLQRSLGVLYSGKIDGKFGGMTHAAVTAATAALGSGGLEFLIAEGRWKARGSLAIALRVVDRRRLLIQKAVVKNPNLGGFLHGWLRRIARVENLCLLDAQDSDPSSIIRIL